jgi:putative two-component system response regulator
VVTDTSYRPNPARTTVLIAEDTENVRTLFEKLLTAEGYHVVSADNGIAAIDQVRLHRPDVILLDISMPGIDGIEVCRRLKIDPATRLTPVLLVTGMSELEDRIKGIEAGADDLLSKPVHPHELRARVASLSRVKRLIDALDSAEAAFIALALAIEARDPTTRGHCERLATHAAMVGYTLGLSREDVDALHRGGYLHDLGKIGIPDSVLLKAGRLTDAEFNLMKRHTEIGDTLCAPLQSLRHVRPIIRSHHERLDGSGYPNGLRGDEIPVLAQIIGVVDVYDAITSERPYRSALDSAAATAFLLDEVRQQRFAGVYVDAFLDTLRANAAPLAAV